MEQDISKMSDHDLLITMHEQIKGIKADIKDLKEGTTFELADHESRVRKLEDYKAVQEQTNKDNKVYIKFIIGIGLLMMSMVIFMLTGYHI